MADRALDRCLAWNAPSIAIDWPLQGNAPIQSEKVAAQPNLSDLPDYFQYSRS
ncbi:MULTISPECIES: hypothetical protein [Hyphomonas]|nr:MULTISPECIES: hypothetical protein [Hyphomonas]